jgi:integrase
MPAKPKDLRSLDWPEGVVWKKHKRLNAAGEAEEVFTPYVRVRTTKDGRRRSVWQQVKSPDDAIRKRSRLKDKFDAGEADDVINARRTFADLAAYYKPIYLIEAQYVDGRKVAGRRSLATVEHQFGLLVGHFGKAALRSITYGAIRRYKSERLKVPTKRKNDDGSPRQRSVASVHRELQLLRHVLNVAVREGWLAKNPFSSGEPLINMADERGRKRMLSREEESRLLTACGERETTYERRRGGKVSTVTMRDRGERRGHLRALLVCLLDTAMRAGEALKLTWDDVPVDGRRATVQEFNTKTLSERAAPVSERLARELTKLYPVTSKRRDRLVFGLTSNFRTSFASACRSAGIEGLRVHDLRRTAATRLVRGGMPIEEVSRILGHKDIQTTYRYIGVDDDTVSRAAAIIDELNREAEEMETVN